MPDSPSASLIECIGGPLDGDPLLGVSVLEWHVVRCGHVYARCTVELSSGRIVSCWWYLGIEDDYTQPKAA